MYKLLLVTDRDEVVSAFEKVPNLRELAFAPITVLREPQAAIDYLERNAADAVGYSIRYGDVTPLRQYLVEQRPSLPIFQTHHHDETLLGELQRIRKFLDTLHADHSDRPYNEGEVLDYLRDELMHQLLAHEIPGKEELKSRLKLVRAELSLDKPALLFDFDMPLGEMYLGGRWHYGRERLEQALRNHFFGRYVDNIYYGVAVLSPRHIRLLACPKHSAPSEDQGALMQRVEEQVQTAINDIKEYLDLDLNLTRYSLIESIGDLTDTDPLAPQTDNK